jgi:hypothetical protein
VRTLGLVVATVLTTLVTPPGPAARTVDPLAVLHRWDAARAAAYAADDPSALRDLYVPHSAVAARDLRLLREYDDHGLRVTSMAVQVFAARIRWTGSDTLRLDLLERTVATACARTCRRIAPDRPRRRVIVVRRVRGEWRVAAAS